MTKSAKSGIDSITYLEILKGTSTVRSRDTDCILHLHELCKTDTKNFEGRRDQKACEPCPGGKRCNEHPCAWQPMASRRGHGSPGQLYERL